MKFEDAILTISEIFHESITKSKEELLEKNELYNLTMGQWCYLEVIYKLKNPTYSELANELKISNPSVSTAVNKLINLGYVYKRKSTDDQRVYYIYLTEETKKAVEKNQEAHESFASRLKLCLSDEEQNQLINICNTIIQCYYKTK